MGTSNFVSCNIMHCVYLHTKATKGIPDSLQWNESFHMLWLGIQLNAEQIRRREKCLFLSLSRDTFQHSGQELNDTGKYKNWQDEKPNSRRSLNFCYFFFLKWRGHLSLGNMQLNCKQQNNVITLRYTLSFVLQVGEISSRSH